MQSSQQAPTVASRKTPWHQILSWQLYDFADTNYSMNVYTRYVSLFIAAAFAKDATAYLLTNRIGEARVFSVLKLPDVRPSKANVLERGV